MFVAKTLCFAKAYTINDRCVVERIGNDGILLVEQGFKNTTIGIYVHLSQPAEAAAQLLQQYQNVEKKALPDFSSMSFHPYYFWFAFPMLLLLMAEIFIPDKKKVTE